MSDKISQEQNKAAAGALPTCKEDCGMEEAFGLGYLSGPMPDCNQRPKAISGPQARTDFTQQPK